jgi:hypothetical protein
MAPPGQSRSDEWTSVRVKETRQWEQVRIDFTRNPFGRHSELEGVSISPASARGPPPLSRRPTRANISASPR